MEKEKTSMDKDAQPRVWEFMSSWDENVGKMGTHGHRGQREIKEEFSWVWTLIGHWGAQPEQFHGVEVVGLANEKEQCKQREVGAVPSRNSTGERKNEISS